VFIPEILGFFQGLIEIVIGDYVFMEPVNAYTLPNIYGVEPVYITDALINENIELPVSISNVLSDEVLVIEEMYST